MYEQFGSIARAVVELVQRCIDLRPMGLSGGVHIDLNDLRYERLLRVHKVRESRLLEEYVMVALHKIRELYGNEHILFGPEDITWRKGKK
ncbi:MAG: hypothetical protein QXS54_01610 [Candidatus Methanomethylicaceae archaeon]